MTRNYERITPSAIVELSREIEADRNEDLEKSTELYAQLDDWAEQLLDGGSSRMKTIFCFYFPEYVAKFVDTILNDNDATYLPMFLRLYAESLQPLELHLAFYQLAKYHDAGTICRAFVALPEAAQQECVVHVGRILQTLMDSLWIRRFWHYVLHVLEMHEMVDAQVFRDSYLTEFELVEWARWQRDAGIEVLAKTRETRMEKEALEVLPPEAIVLKSVLSGTSKERMAADMVTLDGTAEAHFLVCVDGQVFQLESLNRAERRYMLSGDERDDDCVCFVNEDIRHLVNVPVVVVALERTDCFWAEAQFDATLGLFRTLQRDYGIPIDREHVIREARLLPLLDEGCPESMIPAFDMLVSVYEEDGPLAYPIVL